MSILEKFFKNKKGLPETPEPIKSISPKVVQNESVATHAKAILSDGKMYDTSKAKELVSVQEEMIVYGVTICRTYFVTENGRYFSAQKTTDIRKCFNLPANTEIHTMYIDYDDLRLETELAIKEIVGKTDIELYKQLFGEVEEA